MKKKLATILIIALTLTAAAAFTAPGDVFALNQSSGAEEPTQALGPEENTDPPAASEQTTTASPTTTVQATTTRQSATTTKKTTTTTRKTTTTTKKPTTTTKKSTTTTKKTTTRPKTTTRSTKPAATVTTNIKYVTTEYNKSYKNTLKDTITVTPAYGRTVKLYFYDPYKEKWLVKKTYKTENKRYSTLTITYPKLWKSYGYSKWAVECPTYGRYKKGTVNVTIWNKVIQAKAAVIMDGKTGEVLYAFNGRKHMKIASMTKMVTMMVVADKSRMDRKVTITSEAVNARKQSGGMGLAKGDVVYMKDLVHATLMESANDAAAAAACGVSGSQSKFAVLMKEKSRKIGATESTYKYAFGDWHSNTYSTAYDQALIGREFMTNPKYDTLRSIVQKTSYKFKTQKYKKKYTVKMGAMSTALIKNGRSIGIKSGLNPPAGYCYANAWKHNGRLYISIVMGATSQKKLISSQKALMKIGDYSVDHNGSRIKLR